MIDRGATYDKHILYIILYIVHVHAMTRNGESTNEAVTNNHGLMSGVSDVDLEP